MPKTVPAAPPPARKVTRVDLLAPTFGVSDGYGNSAEQIALGLERKGYAIELVGQTVNTPGFSNAEKILARHRVPHVGPLGDAIIFYAQPTSWSKQSTRKGYGFSMYESDELPPPWRQGLWNVDEIWTPSTFNVELFTHVAPRPVYLIPLGVDAKAFSYARRERKEKLRFLHFATHTGETRKGADVAIRAFKAAFPNRDDVELVLRSTFGTSIAKDDSRVKLVGGHLTTAGLADEYKTFDALIYPSRGEGFGLIPLEAMATGMPAIFTDGTGMHDYADLGMPVDSKPVPAVVGHGRGPNAHTGLPYGHWHEPAFDQLVDRLRQVDADYEHAMDRSAQDAKRIATSWSWDRTAQAIAARLEA